MQQGWKKLLDGFPWFEGEGNYPLRAYSEFMPPVHIGFRPYDGQAYSWHFKEDDLFGFFIPEVEELHHLQPGLKNIGGQCHKHIMELGEGKLPPLLAGRKDSNLRDNIYWPGELSSKAGALPYEKYVTFTPVSLSKTRDDKGRTRWTFFGSSEQGPEKAFWKSFYEGTSGELPESFFLDFMGLIFNHAFDRIIRTRESLISEGFRILPSAGKHQIAYWNDFKMPSWTKYYLAGDEDSFDDTVYLMTFRPFTFLPEAVKNKYFRGDLALLPFPGSLLPWGIRPFQDLSRDLYTAVQFPMLRLVSRNEAPGGIRVPQSGWFHQPGTDDEEAVLLGELLMNSYTRTSRWDKVHRHEDHLLKSTVIDPVAQTFFNTTLKALDLYNKPMARNSQILTGDFKVLLDGPRAGKKEIESAAAAVLEGGLFRYRFYFPPMQAGIHEIFWHRPVVACKDVFSGQTRVFPGQLYGYLTAYNTRNPDPANPLELWPRVMNREPHTFILKHFFSEHDHYSYQTAFNIMTILDVWEVLGKLTLDKDFVRHLIRIKKDASLEEWLGILHERTNQPGLAERTCKLIRSLCSEDHVPFQPLTFGQTASREFEENFWNRICFLAQGEYINKDNADVVQDDPTLSHTRHKERDLHRLGDYLIGEYRKMIDESGIKGKAEVGELPFVWETDFDFSQFGGWKNNLEGKEYERNILCVIPGKNRKEAVVMGDHYDTAYMADVYDISHGGTGARLAAAGADDNHSATSTLLLSAPVFMKLSKEGKLERDIWLLHLTGEEFPSDCMGARDFCRNYVQKTLRMKKTDGRFKDLSGVEIKGVFVMDMIAHNRDNAKDIFQISPGRTVESVRLGYTAHLVNRAWNKLVPGWNAGPERAGCKRGERTRDEGRRTKDENHIPQKALFLALEGEVRTWEDPSSSLYNTDVMIFSDTGFPCVLFMENYDINRQGYHDTHDTMENIDLDYGAAFAAIAIETVAQVATEK